MAGNVEVVQAALRAWQEAGLDSAIDYLSPEIHWDVRSDFPDHSGTYQGHEGVRRLFASFDEVVEEMFYEPLEFIESGDQVIVPIRWGGRGKGSGVPFEERDEAWVWTVRDGLVVRIMEYPSKAAALQAVGQSSGL